MDHSEILDKVKALVAETLEANEADLSEETSYEDLGADSFDLLELVTAMEDEFGITVDDSADLSEVKTIGDTVDMVTKAL
ncbi:MAG: acyl carrier protein [Olegusella sp.]|jgi:acyl carrier protein|nr:acyl carrier protein [Olegusella sp.]